jgi:hydrogenase-4 component F
VSEFSILSGAFGAGRFLIGAAFLLLLLVIFVGMGRTVLTVVQGKQPVGARRTPYRDGVLTGLPVVVAFVLVLLLGIHVPAPLEALLREAVQFLEIRP